MDYRFLAVQTHQTHVDKFAAPLNYGPETCGLAGLTLAAHSLGDGGRTYSVPARWNRLTGAH